ncbi:NAD(P)/FAD-dependent oxidoreductase [Nocardia sp. NPDC049149]|uniref:NAD(P)/FAD-dependent oxidoreductase n=1 Tax=Nocardia sp. NPDC049149 TaxID=3364315 RepID=UPI0037137F26
MAADLVVDASGRSSKLPQWLSVLGYAAPPDEIVTSGIGYTTRYYRVPPGQDDAVPLIVIENDYTAANPAGGVLERIEGDMWSACLSGIGGQYPPTDAEGFDHGLTKLINPALAEALRDAEPLTAPRGFRIPVCVRHHYEQMERWPAGLLVLGDALSTVDPIYGQGMTVAAIQAETIAATLRDHDGPASNRMSCSGSSAPPTRPGGSARWKTSDGPASNTAAARPSRRRAVAQILRSRLGADDAAVRAPRIGLRPDIPELFRDDRPARSAGRGHQRGHARRAALGPSTAAEQAVRAEIRANGGSIDALLDCLVSAGS